jgi:hypothetical protein
MSKTYEQAIKETKDSLLKYIKSNFDKEKNYTEFLKDFHIEENKHIDTATFIDGVKLFLIPNAKDLDGFINEKCKKYAISLSDKQRSSIKDHLELFIMLAN